MAITTAVSLTMYATSLLCPVLCLDNAMLLDAIRVIAGFPPTPTTALAKVNFPYSFESPVLSSGGYYAFQSPLAGTFPTYANPVVFGGLSGFAYTGST